MSLLPVSRLEEEHVCDELERFHVRHTLRGVGNIGLFAVKVGRHG